MGVASARHESAHALRPDHAPAQAGDVADVVGGHELVDQLEPSLVPHRLDEQPDLALVELADARPRAGRSGDRAAPQGRIPEGFPAGFASAVPPAGGVSSPGARMVGAPLERERELGTLREGLDRAARRRGDARPDRGARRRGQVRARRARRAARRSGRGCMPLEARGSELEQPFAFGVVRQLLEPVINRPRRTRDLFAGAAGPAARLFEADERPRPAADAGFEALHSLYWLVVNLADRAPLLRAGRRLPVGRSGVAAVPGLPGAADRGASGRDGARRPPARLGGRTRPASLWAQVGSRPVGGRAVSAAAQRVGGGGAGPGAPGRGGRRGVLPRVPCRDRRQPAVPARAAAGARRGRGRAVRRRRERGAGGRAGGREPVRAASARRARPLGERAGDERSRCSETTASSQLAARVSGLSEDAARDGGRRPRPGRHLRSRRAPGVRAPDRARGAVRGSRARRAPGAPRRGRRRAGPRGRLARARHRAPPADHADRRPRPGARRCRSAADGAARRGAPRAAVARLRRALAESPAEQERGEILADLGRYEVAAMQFEAAEEHLRACLTSGADLPTRADAASTLARCAIVSGGRSAEAAVDALASLADELRPLDAERSLELGSELLILATGVPRLRGLLAAQLRALPRPGAPVTPASRRWRGSTTPRSSCGAAAVRPTAAEATRRPSPPACRRGTRDERRLLGAVHAARSPSARAGAAVARRRRPSRPGARATRPVRASSTSSARRSRSRRGRCTTRRSRPRPGCGWCTSATSCSRCCSPWRSWRTSNAETWTTRLELARRGEALELAADGTYARAGARGRPRAAADRSGRRARRAPPTSLWWGREAEALGLRWPGAWKAHAAAPWPRWASARRPPASPASSSRSRDASGRPAGSERRCAPRRTRRTSEDRLALLAEAVSSWSAARSGWSSRTRWSTSAASCTRAGRRREGRDAQRRAIALADACGALALARAGPGRAPGGPRSSRPPRADRSWGADRGRVAGVPPGGGRAHQPRDRTGAVRDREDGRASPQQRLPEARDPLALPARGGDQRLARRGRPARSRNRRGKTRGSPLVARWPAPTMRLSRQADRCSTRRRTVPTAGGTR